MRRVHSKGTKVIYGRGGAGAKGETPIPGPARPHRAGWFAGRAAYVLLVTRDLTHPVFSPGTTGVSRSFDEFYYVQGAISLAEGRGLRFSSFAGAPRDEQAATRPSPSRSSRPSPP